MNPSDFVKDLKTLKIQPEKTSMNLEIRVGSFGRTYLQQVSGYAYDSILDLLLELFIKRTFSKQSAEKYLSQLLEDLGYASIDDIPSAELQVIADYFLTLEKHDRIDYNAEKHAYLLMAAIQRKEILVIVDGEVIDKLDHPIQLKNDSFISFVGREKIDSITFKSL